jgi:hypothetical protein
MSKSTKTAALKTELKSVPAARTARTPRLDRGTALGLLQSCVAADVRCVAEVVRHVRAAPNASRKLLEDLLVIEQAHATELIDLLRNHRIAV